MTTVVSVLLAVVLLAIAVNSAPVPADTSSATYYYEPIVPYGPYPAPGYVVSTYLPKYTSYRIVRYQPRKTEYDEDKQYEEEEPKYYYGGKFQGVCTIDGLYYNNEMSYVVCSNGYASHQPCPPGTKTEKFPSYKAGYYYGASDLCSINLVDFGYPPRSYVPQLVSYDSEAPHSYEKKPVTSYGSDKPKKDTYPPSPDDSYAPPHDPYSPPTYDSSSTSSYHAAASYPAQQPSYQPSDYSPQNTYVVEQPHGDSSYSTSGSDVYLPPSDAGPYPPPSDGYSSPDSYKPSPPTKPHPPRAPTYVSHDTDSYYPPPPSSYYDSASRPDAYKRETDVGYGDKKDH